MNDRLFFEGRTVRRKGLGLIPDWWEARVRTAADEVYCVAHGATEAEATARARRIVKLENQARENAP